MTLSEWWRRSYEARVATANLVSATILFVASVLTFDWYLLGVAILAEVVYLCWSVLTNRYPASPKLSADKARESRLDRLLLVVAIAGIVVILFFGFGKHLLTHPLPTLTHAGGWEAGAIGWTWLFLIYYIIKFTPTKQPTVAYYVGFLYAVTFVLPIPALWTIKKPNIHIIVVWLIAVFLAIIDSLISKKHDDPNERDRSRASLIWADIPMVIALPVLLLYLLIHKDTENPDIFVAGVVSCQLLVSNSVFIVMEFQLLRPPRVPQRVLLKGVAPEPGQGGTPPETTK